LVKEADHSVLPEITMHMIKTPMAVPMNRPDRKIRKKS
jgi:hypothetical protein